jgi:elongation factor P hydroxylase
MPRKVRKDITVAGIERKLKVPKGTIRHPDGRKVNKNKKLENMQ